MEISPPELITVAIANDVIEAELLKSRLETNGVTVYLADDGVIGANSLLSNAVGGVKINVAAADSETARRIVREHRQPKTPNRSSKINTGWGECPRCESKNLKPFREALGWKGIFLLFGLLIFRPKRKLKCNSCDYEWQYR